MYCKSCRKEIDDNSAFCQFCGTNVIQEGSATKSEINDERNPILNSPDDISNTLPELIWRGDSVHGTASVSIPTQRKVNKELDIFCSLYKQLIDERSPISIFSILTIERDMNKWPENVQPLLVDILSDNGFLFIYICYTIISINIAI